MAKKLRPNNIIHSHKKHFWVFGVIALLLIITTIIYKSIPIIVPKSASSRAPISQYQHPPVPIVSSNSPPSISAYSYILVDNLTNSILISKNPHSRIYPASTTKLTTALTALNLFPLDETITIGSTYSEGKIMELQSKEQITVQSLVTALLVYSANDAAYNLANHHQNGTTGFIKEMNQLVQNYNLKNTNFVNFDGIHSLSHYSTAYDLAQIGRLAIKNPIIRDTVKNKKLTVTDLSGKIVHNLESTNELLGVVPEIQGLKTGWTPEAGGSFVSLININGHEIIGVVAQSDDRFEDTRKLIDWVKSAVTWQPYR